jgi:hypothetical protein
MDFESLKAKAYKRRPEGMKTQEMGNLGRLLEVSMGGRAREVDPGRRTRYMGAKIQGGSLVIKAPKGCKLNGAVALADAALLCQYPVMLELWECELL